jgi:sugar lactone lactonase YvrE|tara:strand:+ start:1644 stop:3269 length:1626 start_codon:yes stop_codon:yes gene_type:complete
MLGRNLITSAAGNAAAAVDNSWDIAYAAFAGTPRNFVELNAQDGNPKGVALKADGTKMYHVGNTNDAVFEYDLSTAYDISTATFLQSFSHSSQSNSCPGIHFKPDGTKFYLCDSQNDKVLQYDLTTAWDISTASYANKSASVGNEESVPQDLFFKPDGTKFYVVGWGGQAVNEYAMTTAWDVSTASYNSVEFDLTSQDSAPQGLFFKPDGTEMYVVGYLGSDVNQFTLSTAWSLSTASFTAKKGVSSQDGNPLGVFFKSDGTRFYITGITHDRMFQYDLSTAWSVSSASYSDPTTEIFGVGSQDANPFGLFFKSDGSKMYICGYSTIKIYEYDLSTDWDISTASYSQNFAVNLQEVSPNEVVFKTDGTKMYVIGSSGDEVNEYDLSTAWDISTASFNQLFDVDTQDASMQGLFFKPDGTKMYACGQYNDEVYEYNLSTAWDVSTASFNQDEYIGTQDTGPQQIFFKSDGTRMYMIGTGYDRLYQYDLSTAWDISTLTYDTSVSLSAWDTAVRSVFFKPEGDKFFFVGSSNDNVVAYTIPIS